VSPRLTGRVGLRRFCSARQAKITTELSEIISGAESLKDGEGGDA
jgi:hypothetical protein